MLPELVAAGAALAAGYIAYHLTKERQAERARRASIPCDGTNPRCRFPSHCPNCGHHKDTGAGACDPCLRTWGLIP